MLVRSKVLLAIAFCAIAIASGCSSQSDDAGPPTASIGSEPETQTADNYEAEQSAKRHPVVTLVTTLGEITVELDAARAPITVSNFLAYATAGRYNDTIFHQVEPGFMALAGGYARNMQEIAVDQPIRNEAHNGLKNERGTIAMARDYAAVDSATSQFFFNLSDNAALDYQPTSLDTYGYCVFGKVTAGMDVLERIAAAPVRESERFPKLPNPPVVIETIRRAR